MRTARRYLIVFSHIPCTTDSAVNMAKTSHISSNSPSTTLSYLYKLLMRLQERYSPQTHFQQALLGHSDQDYDHLSLLHPPHQNTVPLLARTLTARITTQMATAPPSRPSLTYLGIFPDKKKARAYQEHAKSYLQRHMTSAKGAAGAEVPECPACLQNTTLPTEQKHQDSSRSQAQQAMTHNLTLDHVKKIAGFVIKELNPVMDDTRDKIHECPRCKTR